MMLSKINVEQILASKWSFEFGNYISSGWKILKSNAMLWILFTFLFMIITVLVSFIPFIGQLALMFVISPALLAGTYIFCRQDQVHNNAEFSDFFQGFNKLGKILPAYIIGLVITYLALIPFVLVLYTQTDLVSWYIDILNGNVEMVTEVPNFPLWTLILLIPYLYLYVSYLWTIPVSLFTELKGWEAAEASRKKISQNWILVFLLTIVSGIIASLGFILLGIGILFTFGILFTISYAAYADAFPESNLAQDIDVINHFID